MKKILFTLALCFATISGFSQIDTKWGERFYNMTSDCQDAHIVMEDPEGYYMWYLVNEYKGEGNFEPTYYMARIDKEQNVQKIYRMDFGSPSFKIIQTWHSGELIGFILSRTQEDKQIDKKGSRKKKNAIKTITGKENLYYQFFHTTAMRLIGEKPEKFKTYNYLTTEGEAPYLFKFSENDTKLVFGFFTSDSSARAVEVNVYDDRMRLLWQKTQPIKISADAYAIKDIAVSNDGKRALLALNSFSTAKKRVLTDGKVHLIWLNEYEQRQTEVQIPKGWATDLKCCFNMQEDYLVAGYYACQSANPQLSTGSFSFLYDDRRGFLKNSSTSDFKEYEKDEDIRNGLPLPSNMISYVDHIYPMIGGNCIIIGEQRYAAHIQQPKRRTDKPTGEEANYFRDIILTNIDKSGYISGNAYIPKRQKTYEESDQYNSYAITHDRYGIYLMFNDHEKNYNGDKFNPSRNYNSDKLRTQVNFVEIYNDASWRWHEAYNSKINKMPLYKTIFLAQNKSILFLSHFQDNNVIGSIISR